MDVFRKWVYPYIMNVRPASWTPVWGHLLVHDIMEPTLNKLPINISGVYRSNPLTNKPTVTHFIVFKLLNLGFPIIPPNKCQSFPHCMSRHTVYILYRLQHKILQEINPWNQGFYVCTGWKWSRYKSCLSIPLESHCKSLIFSKRVKYSD